MLRHIKIVVFVFLSLAMCLVSCLHETLLPVVIDISAKSVSDNNTTVFDRLLSRRQSSQFYYATKASLDYTFLKNTITVGCERISPDCKTLGGYYFNNDYENITVSYARPLFQEKVTIALAGGLQRDDLDNTKE